MDTKSKSRPGLSALAGIQRGLTADLFGLPVDTVANVADLGRAGYGTAMHFIGRPDLAPDILDRTQIIGSGDWIARQLSRTGALMGPADPDSAMDRTFFAFGRGGSGAIFGLRGSPRRAIEVGALGGTSALIAEQVGASTGNPALAAAAALLVGRGQKPAKDVGRPVGRDRDAPGPGMRKQQGEPEWPQIIADTLARLLPKASDAARSSARQDRSLDRSNSGLSQSGTSSPAKSKAGLPRWPDVNEILNSPEYRSYRSGIDEFGLPRDIPAGKGLGENPFYGKTFHEIDRILRERDFAARGDDPSKGLGSYFHPTSGRKYYLDEGRKYGKVYELPHVDVHRMKDGINLRKKKRKLPLGDELVRR